MEKPKSIAEVGKLFDKEFPIHSICHDRYDCSEKEDLLVRSEIKQFWLEHFKSLLEEMRKPNREKPMGEDDNTNIICRDADGYNTRNAEINKHLDNLLSKGEVK